MRRRPMGGRYMAAMIVASALLASGAAIACSCRAPNLALSIADADLWHLPAQVHSMRLFSLHGPLIRPHQGFAGFYIEQFHA